MKKVLNIIEKISEYSGKITAVLILPMIFVVVYNIIMRVGPGRVPRWGFEVSLFIFGIHSILGGAFCLKEGSHVRLDIIINKLPTKWKLYMDILAAIIIIFVMIEVIWISLPWAWQATKMVQRSTHQTAWNPQIWWYKWIIPISSILIFLQSFVGFFKTIELLKKEEYHD